MHRTVYIVSAVRTPIGKFGGAFAEFTASDLGVIAVRAALQRAFGLPLPPERVPGEGPEIDMAGTDGKHGVRFRIAIGNAGMAANCGG